MFDKLLQNRFFRAQRNCFGGHPGAVHHQATMSLQTPPGDPRSEIAAAVPPAGVTSNFDNPPSLERLVIGVCTIMLVLTLLFVTTRVFLAFQSKQRLALDECTQLQFHTQMTMEFPLNRE